MPLSGPLFSFEAHLDAVESLPQRVILEIEQLEPRMHVLDKRTQSQRRSKVA